MNAGSFGLKANGICLEPYFAHGIPSSLEGVIRGLENRLTENNNLLEQCMKEVFEMTQQMTGSEKTFDEPSEAVSDILENRLLDKRTCYDVDLSTVAQVLQSTIKFLEAHPGAEETVLHDLLTLYSSQGLAFPTCASATDLVSQSSLSLHTAVDQSEQVVESLWNNLCLRLRRCFVDKLCRLPTEQSPTEFSAVRQNRVCYVQCLCSLFPAANVLAKYYSLRQQQVQSCLGKITGRKDKFSDLVKTFTRTSKTVLSMVDADFDLFNSGVFVSEVDVFKGIGDIYFDVILDFVAGLFEAACAELPCREKKVEKDLKGMPKSPSDVGFLSRHLKGGLRRQQSQSMESLVGKGDDLNFADLSVMPETVLLSLVQLVKCLLYVESHLETIWSVSSWQSYGNEAAKKTSKKRLKGVLKGAGEEPHSTLRNGKLPYTNGRAVVAEEQDAFDGDATTSRVFPVIQGRLSIETSQFDWRGIFQRTFPELGMWLRCRIHKAVETACKDESDTFDRTSMLPKSSLPQELTELTQDLPHAVSKATWTVLDTIGQMLPLALSGEGIGCSSTITAVFLDAIVFAAQTLNTWLSKLAHESSDRIPVVCLYTGLASSSFLLSCLKSFEKTLKINESSPHQGLASCLDESRMTTEFYVDTIKLFHRDLYVDSVLRDAQSHNWTDAKEFYEGEHCSLDIQMWILNIQQLRHDLWTVCSPEHSKMIFSSVLSDSLNLLAWRYSRIQPSPRRLQQFKSDVSAVLLCTSEMLLSECDSLSQFLDNWHESPDLAAIHESCNSLLAALVMNCSPLDVIYRCYRKGFDKHLAQNEEKGIRSYLSQWMSWLRPTLLPLGQTSIENLATVNVTYLHLSLISQQPRVLPHHLLETLVMKENFISILLLTKLGELMSSKQSAVDQRDEPRKTLEQIFTAFVDVFIKCQHFPDSLAKVVLAVIESSNCWNLFDTSTIIGKSVPVPVWLNAVSKQLKSFTNRVIEPGIRLLLNKLTVAPSLTTPLSEFLNDRLPCGCHPVKTLADGADRNVKDLVAECMYSVITQLVSDIHAVPQPLVIFFHSLQKELNKRGIKSPFQSVGLKILATVLRLALSDVDEISQTIGCPQMDQNLKDNLNMLAECVYYVLTSTHYERGSGAPRIAGLFMKANRNWMSEQIETITELFGCESVSQVNGHSSEDSFSDTFMQELYIVQCQTILGSSAAAKSFVLVQNFVHNNISWILSQLDYSAVFKGDPLLSGTSFDASSSLVLDATLRSSTPQDLNPLELFSKINNIALSQASLLDIKYDWAQLVSADLGLGPISFRNLLFNRPDIRDCGSIEDLNVRKMAEALRKKYGKGRDLS